LSLHASRKAGRHIQKSKIATRQNYLPAWSWHDQSEYVNLRAGSSERGATVGDPS
jgi:hypothetical protein